MIRWFGFKQKRRNADRDRDQLTNMLISFARTDSNRNFAIENHSKVKQFGREDILSRFKRSDNTTTHVAISFFSLVEDIVYSIFHRLPKASYHVRIL